MDSPPQVHLCIEKKNEAQVLFFGRMGGGGGRGSVSVNQIENKCCKQYDYDRKSTENMKSIASFPLKLRLIIFESSKKKKASKSIEIQILATNNVHKNSMLK